MLGGRDFTEMDRAESPRVAVVNRNLAEKEFPGKNPVGERIQLYTDEEDGWDGWVEIVGLVEVP